MSNSLKIAHLYPDLLNLYADKGNILTLVKRLKWRGINVTVESVGLHDKLRLATYHLVLLGGGSDREQALIGDTLRPLHDEWKAAIQDGLPLLAICGGYQLLGEYYELPDGKKIAGLHLLDMYTSAKTPRLIGNVAIQTDHFGSIVGFENHGGRTYHTHEPLGTVISGHGNNGEDGKEGVHYKNVFGTYIHGPLLPKNPVFADAVLETALAYAGMERTLSPLDDEFETSAHQAFIQKRINVKSSSQ
jgi:lipid II isoglutaminyl synthase (glutamine-hydrolysing)